MRGWPLVESVGSISGNCTSVQGALGELDPILLYWNMLHCHLLCAEISSHVNLSILSHQRNLISLSSHVCHHVSDNATTIWFDAYTKDMSVDSTFFFFFEFLPKHKDLPELLRSTVQFILKSQERAIMKIMESAQKRVNEFTRSLVCFNLWKGLPSLDCCLRTTAYTLLSISLVKNTATLVGYQTIIHSALSWTNPSPLCQALQTCTT